MTRTPRSIRTAVATVLVCGLLVAGCSGSKKAAPATSAPLSAPTTAAPPTSPAPPPKPPAVNPFTGLPGVPNNPTIAVKIDDTAPGRPQVGIDQADIVYIEEAEGGLSRLAAIFASHDPTAVGYVRSTRPSDPDLLLQYGKITEAYSGGAHDSLPRVRAAGITSWSNDAGAPYYSRVSRYESSYINLVLNLQQVAKHVKTPLPKDIGLRWSTALPAAGHPGTDVRTMVGSTPVEFKWDAQLHKYVRYIDGVAQRAADGKLVATPNVIVQTCVIMAHPEDTDVNGNPSQFTITVGKGGVIVFRDGRSFYGTWSRPNLSSGTTLQLVSGAPLTLSPGGAWFALVRQSAHTTAS